MLGETFHPVGTGKLVDLLEDAKHWSELEENVLEAAEDLAHKHLTRAVKNWFGSKHIHVSEQFSLIPDQNPTENLDIKGGREKHLNNCSCNRQKRSKYRLKSHFMDSNCKVF